MELSVIHALGVSIIFALSAMKKKEIEKAIGAAYVKKNTARTVFQAIDVGVVRKHSARNVKK